MVFNKTFLLFSFSANAQDLLTTLKDIISQRFYRFASCTRNGTSIPYTRSEL